MMEMMIVKIFGGAHQALAAAAFGAFVALAPAALFAQDAPGEPPAPADFRGKVTLAYGLVFIFVVVYLLLSYRRNAAVREEIAFLERRLAELEARSGNPTKP